MNEALSRQPIGTCAILINDRQEILLGKRKNSYLAGYYGLPSGTLEEGESIELAIEREVMEETGLKSLTFHYLGSIHESQATRDFIHHAFWASVENQTPKLSEPEKCEGWEWCNIDSDFENVLPGHRTAIKIFRQHKR